MPLPDYGHHNAEKKTHQDMVARLASSFSSTIPVIFTITIPDKTLIRTLEKGHGHSLINLCCNFITTIKIIPKSTGHLDRGFNFHTWSLRILFQVFEMAPEIVSDEDNMEVINGKKVKRKRGKVTG